MIPARIGIMQLVPNERRVELSVREFAEFRIGPADYPKARTGRWRAEIGQRWHKDLQGQAIEASEQAEFEVPIKGVLTHSGWSIALQGRVDQIVRTGQRVNFREIKTIDSNLPQDEAILRRTYPSYFVQLESYLALARLDPRGDPRDRMGELVFVDINSGLIQPVVLDERDGMQFRYQLETLVDFVKQRWKAKQRLLHIEFARPYLRPRPGQEDTCEQLTDLAQREGKILFEAPTGFGKTGIVLDFALSRLREGHCERIVYLTGKSTGQIQTIRELDGMIAGQGGLQYFQMRNRLEHAIDSPLHSCGNGLDCRHDIEERWKQSGISPFYLIENGTLTLSRIKELGSRNGICPYEISRAILPYADLWVGDYNYIFSPHSRNVFFQQPSFNPEQTLLVVDEAHNLPGRVAAAFSYEYSLQEGVDVHGELQYAGIRAELGPAFRCFLDYIERIEGAELLDDCRRYELIDILEAVVESLQSTPINPESLSAQAYVSLYRCIDLLEFLAGPYIDKLLWTPQSQRIRFTCLSASPEIAATLGLFSQVILMSATLAPIGCFRQTCGLSNQEYVYFRAEAPWRKNAYTVAIDTRVDTRFKERGKYYPITAETITLLCRQTAEPAVVYFPSFRYAETIAQHLRTVFPEIRSILQPRNMDLNEQNRFLENALLDADVLLLVLGSSFSESVDSLGGRVSRAMVVGPALPEVSAVQDKRMHDRAHLPRQEAFREVYQIPGMIKINQALGRLVRAPGQRALVLLHCRRFMEGSYRELLDEELQNAQSIASTDELEVWLKETAA